LYGNTLLDRGYIATWQQLSNGAIDDGCYVEEGYAAHAIMCDPFKYSFSNSLNHLRFSLIHFLSLLPSTTSYHPPPPPPPYLHRQLFPRPDQLLSPVSSPPLPHNRFPLAHWHNYPIKTTITHSPKQLTTNTTTTVVRSHCRYCRVGSSVKSSASFWIYPKPSTYGSGRDRDLSIWRLLSFSMSGFDLPNIHENKIRASIFGIGLMVAVRRLEYSHVTARVSAAKGNDKGDGEDDLSKVGMGYMFCMCARAWVRQQEDAEKEYLSFGLAVMGSETYRETYGEEDLKFVAGTNNMIEHMHIEVETGQKDMQMNGKGRRAVIQRLEKEKKKGKLENLNEKATIFFFLLHSFVALLPICLSATCLCYQLQLVQ
ncbi:hypothetical protein M8C21_002438, partial [Ambrosia artemisiifolia]